jgi:iron(III) transport system permease protein
MLAGTLPRPMRAAPGLAAQQIILGAVVVAAVAAVTAVPILFVVYGSLDAEAWTKGLVESERTRQAFAFSIALALRAPFAALIGFMLAWLLIRVDLPGRGWLEFLLWIAFFVPSLPTTLGWILLLDPDQGVINRWLHGLPLLGGLTFNIYSFWGILWVHMTASSVPVMVLLLGPAIRQLSGALEESARTCGASPCQILRHVTIPLLAPAILTGTLASFIRGLEAFEVEQLLGVPAGIYVFTTRVYDLVNWEPPRFAQAMAISTVMLVFLVGLAAAHQYFTRGDAHATISARGASFEPLRIGRLGYVISALLFAVVVPIVVLPAGMLVLGSFMRVFGFFQTEAPFTAANWQRVLADPLFLAAVRNSVLFALGAALVGTAVYTGLAYLLVRSRMRGKPLIGVLSWLPWSVPGLLFGLAMLWLVLSNPVFARLYGNALTLVLVVVIAQMPIGVHMMRVAVGQISAELEHSARVCGASVWDTLRDVVVPLIRPMLVSIGLLVFIAAMRDISTVIFLVTPATQTMSTLLLQYSTTGSLEGAAVLGTLTTGIILLVAGLARWIGVNVTPGGAGR